MVSTFSKATDTARRHVIMHAYTIDELAVGMERSTLHGSVSWVGGAALDLLHFTLSALVPISETRSTEEYGSLQTATL